MPPTTFYSLPAEARNQILEYLDVFNDISITIPIRVDQVYRYQRLGAPRRGRVHVYPKLCLPSPKKLCHTILEQAWQFNLLLVSMNLQDELKKLFYPRTTLKLIPNVIIPEKLHGKIEGDIQSPPSKAVISHCIADTIEKRGLAELSDSAPTLVIANSLLDGFGRYLARTKDYPFSSLEKLIVVEDALQCRRTSCIYSTPIQLTRINARSRARQIVSAVKDHIASSEVSECFDVEVLVPCLTPVQPSQGWLWHYRRDFCRLTYVEDDFPPSLEIVQETDLDMKHDDLAQGAWLINYEELQREDAMYKNFLKTRTDKGQAVKARREKLLRRSRKTEGKWEPDLHDYAAQTFSKGDRAVEEAWVRPQPRQQWVLRW